MKIITILLLSMLLVFTSYAEIVASQIGADVVVPAHEDTSLKLPFRVELLIGIDDKSTFASTLTKYLKQDLKDLDDVKVVGKDPDFIIDINGFAFTKEQYVLSITYLKPLKYKENTRIFMWIKTYSAYSPRDRKSIRNISDTITVDFDELLTALKEK